MFSLSSSPDDLYQTKLELCTFSSNLENIETLYVSFKSRIPTYQMKYFEMLNYYIPSELKSPEYFSDFSRFERVSSIEPHKNLPNFKKISYEDIEEVKELYNDKQLLNFNFVQGKLFEKDNNFAKALTCYEEGVKVKEQLSMIEMFKVLIEPKEAQKFPVFFSFHNNSLIFNNSKIFNFLIIFNNNSVIFNNFL